MTLYRTLTIHWRLKSRQKNNGKSGQGAYRKILGRIFRKLVDILLYKEVGWGTSTRESAHRLVHIERGRRERRLIESPIELCEEFWSEFILVAQYLYHMDEESEVADVFEWIRQKDMGGITYSSAMLERVDREVATDCANEQRN